METKKDNLLKSLAKLEDATKMPDYLSKVPEDVRFKNEEKVNKLCSVIKLTSCNG